MGEHKGSGISVMCELLAGALTGGGCGRAGHKTLENNMLSIVLDPARFGTEALMWPELDRYVDFVKSARAAPGHDRVRLPGEPEAEMRAQRGRGRHPAAAPGALEPRAHGQLPRPQGHGGGVQAAEARLRKSPLQLPAPATTRCGGGRRPSAGSGR